MASLLGEIMRRPGAFQQPNADHRGLAAGAFRRECLHVVDRVPGLADPFDVSMRALDIPTPPGAAILQPEHRVSARTTAEIRLEDGSTRRRWNVKGPHAYIK